MGYGSTNFSKSSFVIYSSFTLIFYFSYGLLGNGYWSCCIYDFSIILSNLLIIGLGISFF